MGIPRGTSALHPIADPVTFQALCDKIFHAIHTHYTQHFSRCVCDMLDKVCMVKEDSVDGIMCYAQSHTQLLFFPGVSIPIHHNVLSMYKDILHPHLFAQFLRLVERCCVRQYAGVWPIHAPDSWCVQMYTHQVYFVCPFADMCNVHRLIDIFTQKLLGDIHSDGDDVTLLVRGLEDLMYIHPDDIHDSPVLAMYTPQQTRSAPIDAEVEEEDKGMRGKYEILYGEYRKDTNAHTQTHTHMHAFTKLIEILFSYLITYMQQTQRSKSIHITSCVCASGVGNFVLKYIHNDVPYTITHDSLVQHGSSSHTPSHTHPYAPLYTPSPPTYSHTQSPYTSPVDVMKGLLPTQVVFIETPSTPTHATLLHQHTQAEATAPPLTQAHTQPHMHIQTPSYTHTPLPLESVLTQTHTHTRTRSQELIQTYKLTPHTRDEDFVYGPVNILRARIHATTTSSCVLHIHTTGMGVVYVYVYDLPMPYQDTDFARAMKQKSVSSKFQIREKQVLYATYTHNIHEVTIHNLSPYSKYGVHVYVHSDLIPSPGENSSVVKGLKRADSNVSATSNTSSTSKSGKGASEARGISLTLTTPPDTLHLFSTLLIPAQWRELVASPLPVRAQKAMALVRTLRMSSAYVMYADGDGDGGVLMGGDGDGDGNGYGVLKMLSESNVMLPTSFSVRTGDTDACVEELVSVFDMETSSPVPIKVPVPTPMAAHNQTHTPLQTLPQTPSPSFTDTFIPTPQIHVSCMVQHGLYVKHQGNFMVVCPKYTNHSCLQDVIKLVRSLHTHYPHVRSLVIMSGRLLIPASAVNLHTHTHTPIGMIHTHAHTHIEFFETIIQWQKDGDKYNNHEDGRRCIILGTGHVKRAVSVNIGHHYMTGGDTAAMGDDLQQPSFVTASSLPSNFPSPNAFSPSPASPVPASQPPSPQKAVDELPSLSLYGSSANHAVHIHNPDDIWDGHPNAIRYVILPRQKDIQTFDLDESMTDMHTSQSDEFIWEFDVNLVNLQDDLYYQAYVCDGDDVLHAQHITYTPAHTHWYGDGMDIHEDAREIMYSIDILHHPDVYVSAHNGMVLGPQRYWISIQEVLHEYDVFHVSCGPVVGLTTQTEARILFELSHDARELTCTLIPSDTSDDETTHIHRTLSLLEAFTPRIFHFSGLLPNTKYTITLPQVSKLTSLGMIRTLPKFSSSLSVIIIGGGEYSHLPIVEDIKHHLKTFQCPHMQHLRLLNQFVYEENRDYIFNQKKQRSQSQPQIEAQPSLSDSISQPKVQSQPFQSTTRRLPQSLPSLSTLLLAHTKLPGCTPLAIFHLAPQTIMSSLWSACSDRIIEQCEKYLHYDKTRCELTEFYYKQCEKVVKDAIRVLWTHPSVQGIFNSYANFFLYHSTYYLSRTPRTSLPPRLHGEGEVREVLQEIFTAQVHKYVAALYHSKENVKDYFSVWKLGALCICMLDLASGREREAAKRKERRGAVAAEARGKKAEEDGVDKEEKGEDAGDDEEGREEDGGDGESDAPSSPVASPFPSPTNPSAPPEEEAEEEWVGGFSRGFLDKNQWKSLRASCSDDAVYQLVVLMERPLIALDTDLTTVTVGSGGNGTSTSGTGTGTGASTGISTSTSTGAASGYIASDEDWDIWKPTSSDLTTFLTFFIEWIATVRRKTKNAESRSVLFVSSYKIPYITVFQDLKTGIKVHQMCVGDYSLGKKADGLDPTSKYH